MLNSVLITYSLHPPSHISTHPHIQPPPQLKPFNVEQFLKGMEGAGPHLTSGIKGNWAGLYRYLASFTVIIVCNILNWVIAGKLPLSRLGHTS